MAERIISYYHVFQSIGIKIAKNYIDVKQITESYNNTVHHSTTGFAPNNINDENHEA
jgi:hypothetical protein